MGRTASSSLAGSLTIILVWVLSSLGVTVPPEVSSALTTVIMAGTVLIHGKRDVDSSV